jgi:hypothetical protein
VLADERRLAGSPRKSYDRAVDDLNLKLVESWFRLLAEAARGTRTAQDTIRGLVDGGLSPQELARQIARILPSGVSPPTAEDIGRWTEGFWATAGVVPRARYLELLERYEALRERLEEAEVTIRRLKAMLSEKGHERDAEKLLDVFASTVGDTLKAQADWMRSWIPLAPEGNPRADEKPTETKAKTGRKGRSGADRD